MSGLALAGTAPFARGGNRDCYIHPQNPALCIKLLRSDRSPEMKRRSKPFPKSLKPLSSFDDNLQELKTYRDLQKRFGDALHTVCAKIEGMQETDLGLGLVSEMIRDHDGKISISLKQYLWENGLDEPLRQALDDFCSHWQSLAIPSRDLLLHNIVVQQNGPNNIARLVVIDGIGWPAVLSFDRLIPAIGHERAKRRVNDLRSRIDHLLAHQAEGGGKGYHGFIESEKRDTHHAQ